MMCMGNVGSLKKIQPFLYMQGIMGEGYGPPSSGMPPQDDFTFSGEQTAKFYFNALSPQHG